MLYYYIQTNNGGVMERVVIIGEFISDIVAPFIDKQIKKDWEIMELKSRKHASTSLRDGWVFGLSMRSLKHSENWLEKMQILANNHEIETNFEYHVISDLQEPNLKDIIENYYKTKMEEL